MTVYVFWILLGIIVYSYIGYTIILLLLSLFKRKRKISLLKESELPEVTLVIAAYNEKQIIPLKSNNTSKLNYPKEKLHCLWITDGSNDGSEKELERLDGITVLHQPQRKGKTAALNRAMEHITTPYTIFCDANTMLHPDSIIWMVSSLCQKDIGCVAGTKKVTSFKRDTAAGAGESTYWGYESMMKNLESRIGSTIGAAGELFGIKTELYSAPNQNTILDDFVISLQIALKGYKIFFQPKAIATEDSSASIKEEQKRKTRIAAGSFQVLFGMPELMNFFKNFTLSFQYLSHKVLRWLLVPLAIPVVFILNIWLYISVPENQTYLYLLILQLAFYLFAFIGAIFQNSPLKIKILFAPYYLVTMNHAMIKGFLRFIRGSQNVAWEKSERKPL